MLLLLGFLGLTGVYGWLIYIFKKNWESLPLPAARPVDFNTNLTVRQKPHAENLTATPAVSIIIPARNEEKNIGALLKALANQTHTDNLEIIVVDDHSEDHTAAIAASFAGVRVISLQEEGINSYKKKAVEKGVQIANGELILCTDADCVPGPEWISTIIDCYLKKTPLFIAAPVLLTNDGSWLGKFQTLDFMVLQGITGAGIQSQTIYMANGANMAYPKKVFDEVEGYRGIDRLASGDDFFLLHKIAARYPNKIAYLKSSKAVVRTAALATWHQFLQQRIRWASKSTSYKDARLLMVLMLVWFYNACFLLIAMASFFDLRILAILTGGITLKVLLEWPFVKQISRFFQVPVTAVGFIVLQPLHILYTVLAGLLGLLGRYEWKGRMVK